MCKKFEGKNTYFCCMHVYYCHWSVSDRLVSHCLPIVVSGRSFSVAQRFLTYEIALMLIKSDYIHRCKNERRKKTLL